MPDERRATRAGRIWREWVRPLVVVLTVLAGVRSSLADWHDVPTQSMEPTILVGDRIAVNKLAYDLKVPFTTRRLARWSEPDRGDIVVFYAPGSGTRMVKRVVGLPGDRVALSGNRLVVDGRPVPLAPATAAEVGAPDLTDPPPHRFRIERLDGRRHALLLQPRRPAPRSFPEVRVPAGHYFVMGDNRDNSGDSRVFAAVPRDRILGRVAGVAVSLDRDAGYRPRWRRFFRGVE